MIFVFFLKLETYIASGAVAQSEILGEHLVCIRVSGLEECLHVFKQDVPWRPGI
jgi:hypothetical protein